MKYVEWIKESKTYICPKTGVYKIICVGGGASGGFIGQNGKTIGSAGSATSFGNILSANGGSVDFSIPLSTKAITGGQSGYDGVNYASSPLLYISEGSIVIGGNSVAGIETGHGYGAGGGAIGSEVLYKTSGSSNMSFKIFPASGRCGKMESTIVDLNEGQTVACTIGKGGTKNLTDGDIVSLINASTAITLVNSLETVKSNIKNGAYGLIIVQYLGESM